MLMDKSINKLMRDVLLHIPSGKIDMKLFFNQTETCEGADAIEKKALLYEIDGTDCPICKKAWKKIDVINLICEYSYYTPDCNHYPICPFCNRKMIIERIAHERICRECGAIFCKNTTKDNDGNETLCYGSVMLLSDCWSCILCHNKNKTKFFMPRDREHQKFLLNRNEFSNKKEYKKNYSYENKFKFKGYN